MKVLFLISSFLFVASFARAGTVCAIYCLSQKSTSSRMLDKRCIVDIDIPPAIWTSGSGDRTGVRTKTTGQQVSLDFNGTCPKSGNSYASWAVLIESCPTGENKLTQFNIYEKNSPELAELPEPKTVARCFTAEGQKLNLGK